MFEKLKKLLIREKHKEPPILELPPVLITIHGYGRRRKHEMDNLALWGKEEGYEIVQFDMYDLFDEHDCEANNWIKRASQIVKQYEDANRTIYLLGFSMGGVIASHLAATYNVTKLILLAPAFSYLHMENITTMISKGAATLFTNDKKEKQEIEIPRSFYGAFMEIIKTLKHSIADVSCPVLFLHGDEDEVISLRSSLWGYEHIPHKQKKLIILHEGHHRLLMDETVNWECYQIIRLFLDNKILNGKAIPQSADILEQYQKERLETLQRQNDEKTNCAIK